MMNIPSVAAIPRAFSTIALSCLVVVALGCSSDSGESTAESSSTEALVELGSGFGLDTYDRLASATAALQVSVADQCVQNSDQSMAVAKDFYADARVALSAAEAIWIGPAEDERSLSTIDPAVVADDIEDAIASIPSADLSAEYVSTRVGTTKRGLRTVEYLLFDHPVEPGDTSSAPAHLEAGRCAYAEAVAGSVEDEAAMLLDRWKTGDDIRKPYSAAIGNADDAGMTTSDLLNSQIALMRNLADSQLSPALGLSGDPDDADVNAIVEGGAEMGTDTMLTQVQAVRDVLVGSKGDAHFAGSLGEELTDDVLADTDAIVQVGEEIVGSLRIAAVDQSELVTELYEAIEGLEATLSTQVTEALGVTMAFTGGDGDGGS